MDALLASCWLTYRGDWRGYLGAAGPDEWIAFPLTMQEIKFAIQELAENCRLSRRKERAAQGFQDPSIDILDRFLQDTQTKIPEDLSDEDVVPAGRFYEFYRSWCLQNSISKRKILTSPALGRAMVKRGFRTEVRTIKGFSQRFRIVNKASELLKINI
ncbi:unnamed protein product [Sphagnum balticum]